MRIHKEILVTGAAIALLAFGFSSPTFAHGDNNDMEVRCKFSKDGKDTFKDMKASECTKKGGSEVMIHCKGKTDGNEWEKDMTLSECKKADGKEMK